MGDDQNWLNEVSRPFSPLSPIRGGERSEGG